LGKCDGCGAEVSDEELYRCGECGKAYCEECAVADGVIKTLVYAQTAKRSMKPRKTIGGGSSTPLPIISFAEF